MEGRILQAFLNQRKVNKTDLARQWGMSKQNLFKMFESRVLSDESKALIEKHFKTKWGTISSSVNIDYPAEKPPVKGTDSKYVALLENNDQFFKNLLNSSLIKMAGVQDMVIAHLKAIIQESAESKSQGDRKEQERLMKAWGKRIAENLGVSEQKGIGVGAGR